MCAAVPADYTHLYLLKSRCLGGTILPPKVLRQIDYEMEGLMKPTYELGPLIDYPYFKWVKGKKVRRTAMVRQILVPGASPKYHLVLENPSDPRREGEIIAVSRTEDARRTTFPFWTVPSLVRTGNLGLENALMRRIKLLDSVSKLEEIVPELAHHGRELRDDPMRLRYVCVVLSAEAAGLERAETRRRVEAFASLLSALDVTDSLGRYNPGATAAKLTRAKPFLAGQAEWDINTIGSMSGHRLAGNVLAEKLLDDLWQLECLYRSGRPRLAKKMGDPILKELLIKPGFWVRQYYYRNHGEPNMVEMADICQIERVVWQIDDARSLLQNNPALRGPDTVWLLAEAVAGLPRVQDDFYLDLVVGLQQDVADMQSALVADDGVLFNRACNRAKRRVRN